ncbi:hypothetical protein Droror1_Dr00008244, partial [Drosera rotundifolia]
MTVLGSIEGSSLGSSGQGRGLLFGVVTSCGSSRCNEDDGGRVYELSQTRIDLIDENLSNPFVKQKWGLRQGVHEGATSSKFSDSWTVEDT